MMSLTEMMGSRSSVTGYDLEQIVLQAMKEHSADEDVAIELYEKYFSVDIDSEKVFKPLKFVYYKVRDIQGSYEIRRDWNLSPKASLYFDKSAKTMDDLRTTIVNKTPILGKDLKMIVKDYLKSDFDFPNRESTDEERQQLTFLNFSKQLAVYINTYFVECDKPISDEVWYGINCREYGTATIYRDLEKSPRAQRTQK